MQSRRWQRIWAGVLLAVFLGNLSIPQMALADAQETADFAEMVYVPLDMADFNRRVEVLGAISQEAVNANAVRIAYGGLVRLYGQGRTALELAQIHYQQDVADGYWSEQVQISLENVNQADAALMALSKELLASPCAPALQEAWGEPFCQRIVESQTPSQEQLALEKRQQELMRAYDQAYLTAFDIVYRGKTYDVDNPWQVNLPEEEQMAYWQQAFAAGNVVLAPIYQQLVEVRTDLAQLQGYDDFNTYAYAHIYGRDYTTEEVQVLREQVVKYVAPLLSLLLEVWQSGAARELPAVDTSEEGLLALVSQELTQIAPELAEAFAYMETHELLDCGSEDNRLAVATTRFLPQYGAPFTQIKLSGSYQDLLTLVHEFGHYNNYYHNADDYRGWQQPVSYDLAEVHSQGLEMLFCSRYEQIWGRQAGRAMALYHLINSLDTIVQGALEDEFQQTIYANPQMTIAEMNTLYAKLKEKYQVFSLGDSDESWVLVPNTYHEPLYYISYTVSMTTALELWAMARRDTQQATDCYLELVGRGERESYQQVLRDCGLPDPFASGTIKNLAQVIGASWGLNDDGRQRFLDISNHWAQKDIYAAVGRGLFAGTEPMIFDPEAPLSRAMAVVLVSRALGVRLNGYTDSGFVDVPNDAWYAPAVAWAREQGITDGIGGGCFGPDEPMTREQLAALLDHLLKDSRMLAIHFTDYDTVSDWAKGSVAHVYSAGLMKGRENGEFAPQASTTRAEAAVIFLRLLSTGIAAKPAA